MDRLAEMAKYIRQKNIDHYRKLLGETRTYECACGYREILDVPFIDGKSRFSGRSSPWACLRTATLRPI